MVACVGYFLMMSSHAVVEAETNNYRALLGLGDRFEKVFSVLFRGRKVVHLELVHGDIFQLFKLH